MSDHALYLCFAPKYPDDPSARKKRSRCGSPHFGAKLQSLAIDLNCSRRVEIRAQNCSRSLSICLAAAVWISGCKTAVAHY